MIAPAAHCYYSIITITHSPYSFLLDSLWNLLGGSCSSNIYRAHLLCARHCAGDTAQAEGSLPLELMVPQWRLTFVTANRGLC